MLWIPNISGYETIQENTSLSNYLRGSKGSQLTSTSEDEDLVIPAEPDEFSEFVHDCKLEAREWGVHRFESEPWPDKDKPYIQKTSYDDLKLTEDEKRGILSDAIIAACSSYLQMLPEVHRVGLVKCSLSHKQLNNISALRFYHYFQYVDLSYNKIKDLSVLSQLPFLTHLDASHNQIENVLEFKAPFNLTKVNLGHNKIKNIPDLTEFWSITDLNLSHNEITVIEGLENLRYLSHLNLAHNSITKLGNLNNLRVQYLQLQHNKIDKTTQNFSLKTLCHLRHIDLSHNHLDTLWFFEDADNLEHIEMAHNRVANLMNIYYLSKLRYLTKLNLHENPVCLSPYFYSIVISVLRHVRTLNGEKFEIGEALRKVQSGDAVANQAAEQRVRLLLLTQVNRPDIGDHVFPYDQPPPPVVILVGPPGSRKRELARKFCAIHSANVVRGVSHTTRKRNPDEIEGDDYYYIDKEMFSRMLSEGKFLACSEFLGEYYGIAASEFSKAYDGVMLFHSDLYVALTMKVRSINPKLVLALPFAEECHVRLLLNKYCRIEENGAVYVRNCPEEARKAVERFEECLRKKIIEDVRNLLCELVDAICSPEGVSSPDSGVLIMESDSSTRWSDTGSKAEKYGNKFSDEDEVCNFIMDDTIEISDTDIIFYESTQNAFKGRNYNRSSSNKVSASAINYISSGEFTEEFAESIQTFFGDQMSTFFNSIRKSRQELLELHWSSPGLFREVIFTDNENEAMKKLKDMIKYIIKYTKHAMPLFVNYKKQGCAKNYLKNKVNHFFQCIARELSTSDKQYQDAVRDFFYPHSHTCKNDTCPACLRCYVK